MIEKLSNKENPTLRQKAIIYYIKYGPYMMALTCALKCFIYKNFYPMICQYINVILNTVITVGFLLVGKEYRYSRFHNIICYVAIVGYILYILDLIIGYPESLSEILSEIYLGFVFILFILYKKV